MHRAEVFRRKWHEKAVAQEASTNRCPNCQLEGQDDATTCEIHALPERWLDLLNRYVARDISSRASVVDTLSLLRDHKERLKKRTTRASA